MGNRLPFVMSMATLTTLLNKVHSHPRRSLFPSLMKARVTETPEAFPISLPVEIMRDSYDIVIIGTGYGGGVAVGGMSRGQQKVCVLELGKEQWPGEFPETLAGAIEELHFSGEFAPGDRRGIPGHLADGGNPTGFYNFVGEGQNIYSAHGLGGTNLVNANVFLEATPAILEMSV